MEDLRRLLDDNGFDPVEALTPLPSTDLPVLTRCRGCGRQAAQRPGDIGWGCSCTQNTRAGVTSTRDSSGKRTQELFADSKSPALEWWDHDANSERQLQTVTVRATRMSNWACPNCDYRFAAKVLEMVERPRCPECEKVRLAEWGAEYERMKVTPVADVPELLAAWDDEDDPRFVMVAPGDLRRFRCPEGHHPRLAPLRYLHAGCQFCRSKSEDRVQRPTLADALPEIASQWHPTRNGNRTPQSLGPASTRTVWWLATCCNHEWPEAVRDRDKYKRQRCPRCKTILDSLAWSDPGLAAEWSPENPVSAWRVRPTTQTVFVPRWVCSVDADHRWEATLASRAAGSECPECRVTGKSRVELEHLEAARAVFQKVRSGPVVRNEAFRTRTSWTVDILAEHDNTGGIAIEYDGAYWHAPDAKILVDQSKSRDLIAAGYLVVRLREDDLPPLGIDHPRYLEVTVYSTVPRPAEAISKIVQWIGNLDVQESPRP